MTAKVVLSSLCLLWLAPAARAQELPSEERLLEIEAVTESFVNRLHDLSGLLAARDLAGAAAFFAERLAGRLPDVEPSPPAAEGPLLLRRSWPIAAAAPRDLSREELLKNLGAFLDRLATIERIRFEVPRSDVDAGSEIEAWLELSIFARNRAGQREWITGRIRATARRTDGEAWQITTWVAEELGSLIAPRDLFNDVTAAAGMSVPADLPLLEAGEAGQRWYPNGAAACDVDQDGLLDLFVTGPNESFLYLNQGDGTFRDGAARAGLKNVLLDKPELNPVFFDFDNDGDSDLFITSEHYNVLLENRLQPDRRLHFRNVTQGLPQNPDVQGWSVAVGDVNGDGLPDLYVVSYLTPMKGPQPKTTVDDVEGRPNLLLINRGGGTFSEESAAWGVTDSRFSMAAQFADVDGDHDLDLYVANDFGGGNSLFINQGDRFVDEARERGALLAAESMGVSFADYDNDGDLDLHVTNMSSVAASRFLDRLDGLPLRRREHLENQWSGNTLLQNQGDGTFRDVSAEAGPFHADWAWGGGFLDVDNDGWEDLHTPNGHLSGRKPYDARGTMFSRVILALQQEDREKVLEKVGAAFRATGGLLGQDFSFGGHTGDRMYLNRGDGTFIDVSGVSGTDTYPSDARSSVYADFDNDGDLDVFMRATHGRAHFLFRNEVGQDKAFLRVALAGTASGRDAFGTVVRVQTSRGTFTKAKRDSNGYLAQGDPRLVFALGERPTAGTDTIEAIEVLWPSGARQRFAGPPPGDSLLIVEGEEQPRVVEEKRFRLVGPVPVDP